MEKDLKHTDSTASQPEAPASDDATIIVKKTPDMAASQPAAMSKGSEIHTQPEKNASGPVRSRTTTSTRIVTADSVRAEEVPTIPIDSLESINALEPEVAVHSVSSTRSVRMPTPLVVQPSEYRRTTNEWLHVWVDGIRPSYLPLSFLPALLGTVLAWTQSVTPQAPFGHFHVVPFVAMLISLLFLQLGAHLVNDYYDYLRSIDTGNALGPGGLIQQGLVKPTHVLTFGLVLLGLGALLGLFVASAGGAVLYLFGLIGLLCAYFYSAPPRALSSLGLGELVAFLLFGPLITMGAYAVQAGHIEYKALVYSLPLGLMAAAVIHLNNMRDIEGDMHAGKRTVASLIGIQLSRIWLLVLLLSAYTILIFLAVPHSGPHLILIALWTFPLLVLIISGVLRTDTPASIHMSMRQTLRLETYFTLLLVVALIVLALLPVLPHMPAHILPF
ncbi:MAG: 1,4-dihydroxy-2-naphthoate octaprenyltransferase [Ktedonobacteraceae bacterium]|nr:1,4-dihydroxy-2-naphthoate octaprenyltransferase [Ktedonobacteraceae bacterium]